MRTRILLRDVIDEDLPVFFEHHREPEASRMAAFPIRERKSFMDHWARVRNEQAVMTRTVLLDDAVYPPPKK